MEFHIERSVLLAGIYKTLGIVEKKSTIPMLNNVLLKAKEDKLVIVATDREIALVAKYEADIASEGEIAVSAKKLYEMIREIPGGSVHVKTNDNNLLTVSCQKLVYKINGMSADEFPTVSEEEDIPLFDVRGELLSGLIAKSYFAISLDETRRNLTGALLEIDNQDEGKILRLVATDGHRMALSEAVVDGGTFMQLEKGVIIPRKGLLEVRKLVEEGNGDVRLGIQGNMCVVIIPGIILRINLIDAEFPDYRRVIPKEKGVAVKLERDAFFHSLRRVSVVSSEGYGGVVISLSNNVMVLKSNDYNVGEAFDEIGVSYEGEEIVVGYDVGYLLNAIDVIAEKDVVFEIGHGTKPSLVKGDGNDRYMCIVMPLKL